MRFLPALAGSIILVFGSPVFSAQLTDPTPRRASAREKAQAKSKHLPGQIIVDPQTQATSRPRVYAGGDGVRGPASMIEATADGKRAALSIDRLLRGEDEQGQPEG